MILFNAGQFGSAQTAGTADLDAFGAEILGGLQRLFHRAAEGNTAFELKGDVLGNELGVGLGMFDLDDVDVNFFAGHLAELFFELVDFGAFAADDDARPGGQDGDAAAVGGAFDEDLGHGGGLELLLEQLADVAVLGEQFAEFFFAGDTTSSANRG